MNQKLTSIAFGIHAILEIVGSIPFLYMALSADMSFIQNMWPTEMWHGIDITSAGYRYPIWVIGNLILGQGILGLYAMRSKPNDSIRKVCVVLFAMFHVSVSIISNFAFPEMSGGKGFVAQLANPHFYMGVWFLVLCLLMLRQYSQRK